MTDTLDVGAAYARGRVNFMGLDMLVAPGALVPRPETELLAHAALEALGGMDTAAPRVIDVCCGAGNLACALAHRLPQAHVWASDLTPEAIAVARRNVDALGLDARVSVHQGDLFAPLAALGLDNSIDAIVCNPPYISEKRLEGDRAELLEHEPREAFAAGPYGLAIHMRVVKDAIPFLRPGGVLLFEVGLGQARQVELLFQRARAYENVRSIANSAGEARVVAGVRRA